MKMNRHQMVKISFMLFSLFFGAGNLIFPPFLGQNAADRTPMALLGFLLTAVVLPVLGVIVISQFGGLEKLGAKVSPKFALLFSLMIYLSIGPGLGIPRAASVPFEMAVAPYLPESANLPVYMLLYSLVFFCIACWLSLNPSKMLNRFGNFLTPSLLVLILFLFVSFLFRGQTNVGQAQDAYAQGTFLKGFVEGYQTMDTIAALNFGLVISTTLMNMGIREKKDVVGNTVKAGIRAGTILALVYVMLSYMGMQSSGVYEIHENGAWTLRAIVYQLFGNPGAVLLAAIFTLACLTTCVGLITSISQYFNKLFGRISYRTFVFGISIFAFLVCNLGLNTILSISVPVLNAVYPVSILLILLGLCERWIGTNTIIYPATIASAGVVSVVYALEGAVGSLGIVSNLFGILPGYDAGFGWVCVAAAAILISLLFGRKTESSRR